MVREQIQNGQKGDKIGGESTALAEEGQIEQWRLQGRVGSHSVTSRVAAGRAAPGVRAAKSSESG